ncbi:MAG: Chymotrypsin-like protein protease-3 [Candidatus Roizmanbacteria bacterium GW2011_GWA2_35_19]|uniref:Chymotrypsin-like protein protease-3 n=2 Tax=Candidatus Roizmaniibacteriota TaxID=1752723 RepID=A0A0G0CAS7_9BACT|nr:MAG: Chymotrypsin-like protein protease-3 [Candidatus Roizmanbacteria bacterium GW2011_GWC2_35_12]KKP73211.1 MAG: Chymotrypsin-like protein protease-3 [Candidatus Roizmanbacteria bacterium GW2011_GWA2_35_19]
MKNNFCFDKKYLFLIMLFVFFLSFYIGIKSILNRKTTTAKASNPSIYYGEMARDNEFPYNVVINNGYSKCGGSLIHEEYVLTAAHCLYDGSNKVIDSKKVSVIIGLNHINKELLALHTSYVDKVIINQNYQNKTPGYFDIALLHLTKSARGIPTISIPNPNTDRNMDGIIDYKDYPENFYSSKNEEDATKNGNTAVLIGFGITEKSKNNTDLMKTKLFFVKNTVPSALFNANSGASFYNKSSGCDGDSGSPLALNKKRLLQIGIMSSSRCPNFFLFDSGTFTSVISYANWIQVNIPNFIFESGSYDYCILNKNCSSQTSQKSYCFSETTIETCNYKNSTCGYYSCDKTCKAIGSSCN